jgi:UDP-2,3-diacylglucosamine hydrolase
VGVERAIRFISDVHFPSGGAREFLDFLRETAECASRGECGTLYVLGDLFGFWYEAGGRPPPGFDEILAGMRDAVSRGLRIVVLRGNRDFLLGPAFTRSTGAELAPDELEITLGGTRVHLTHGDVLATGDHRYQLWRRLSRGLTFKRIANGLPRWLADRVARAFRLGSEFEKGVKKRTSMYYSAAALGTRIAAGADVVIAGHVHEPEEREIEAGDRTGRLVVLGPWDEGRGVYAEWSGGSLRLVR